MPQVYHLAYTVVRNQLLAYTGDMEREPIERTTREVREHLADVIGDAIAGKITYITSNGRRVAAVVPLTIAEIHQSTGLGRTTVDRIGKDGSDA